jgi:hypothetical protein
VVLEDVSGCKGARRTDACIVCVLCTARHCTVGVKGTASSARCDDVTKPCKQRVLRSRLRRPVRAASHARSSGSNPACRPGLPRLCLLRSLQAPLPDIQALTEQQGAASPSGAPAAAADAGPVVEEPEDEAGQPGAVDEAEDEAAAGAASRRVSGAAGKEVRGGWRAVLFSLLQDGQFV